MGSSVSITSSTSTINFPSSSSLSSSSSNNNNNNLKLGLKLLYLNEFLIKNNLLNNYNINIKEIKEKYIKINTKYIKNSYCYYLKSLNYSCVDYSNIYISYSLKLKFLKLINYLNEYFKDDYNPILWIDIFSMNLHHVQDNNNNNKNNNNKNNNLNQHQNHFYYENLCDGDDENEEDVSYCEHLQQQHYQYYQHNHNHNNNNNNNNNNQQEQEQDIELTEKLDLGVQNKNNYNDDSNNNNNYYYYYSNTTNSINTITNAIFMNPNYNQTPFHKNSISFFNSFQRHVLILPAWKDNLSPLNETSCLWELYCSLSTNHVKFEIAMPKNSFREFKMKIMNDPIEFLKNLESKINLENSECSKYSYRKLILQTIKSSMGFTEFNKLIYNKIQDWIIDTFEDGLCPNYQNENMTSDDESADYVVSHNSYNNNSNSNNTTNTNTDTNATTNSTNSIYLSNPNYLNVLAVLHKSKFNYVKSEIYYEKILALKIELYGYDHIETLTTSNNLSEIYYFIGKHEKSKLLLEKTLSLSRHIKNDSIIITSLNIFSKILTQQKDYVTSINLLEECLSLNQQVYGLSHISTYNYMIQLGELYNLSDLPDKAESIYQNCLKNTKEFYGFKHELTLSALKTLTLFYQTKGDFIQMQPLMEELLSLQTDMLGEKHPETLTCLYNLAGLYKNQNDYVRAELFMKKCLNLRKEVLGVRHPDSLKSLHNLSLLYSYQGEYDEAKCLLEECLSLYCQVYGERSANTILIVKNLAAIYHIEGDYNEGTNLLRLHGLTSILS